ncbi:hypothetical protein [Maricaulis sp.]|uniref:hypothetical protein n=1 Tax=Maricaulis sp. TaxID=1486257 RepID=UPI003A942BEE
MTGMFSSLDARNRLLIAWAMLGGAALLVALPVILSAVGMVQAWQETRAVRQTVLALTERVGAQTETINAWYERHGETEDTVREYSDPDLARQALDADLDRISEALIGSGAHLLQAPNVQQAPLGGDVIELAGTVQFSGALSDVLRAFAGLEHTGIRLADLNIIALPGQPEGRVRGRLQLRHSYLVVVDDES